MSIDPYLTAEHLALRNQAREFAQAEIQPRIARLEAAGTHADRDLPRLMGALGWFGVLVGPEYGGMSAGHVGKSVLLAEISYVSGAAGAILQASLIPTLALDYLGSDEQKRQWLPRIARGSSFPTIAVTEPERGSHVLGMSSVAERDGDEWVLSGQKCFVGNSGIADLHLVVVRTGDPGHDRSLSAFLVESDRPGVAVTQPLFVGLHGFTTGTLLLDGVRVPADNLLGSVGDGLEATHIASIVCGRPNLAAVALGLHRRVLEVTKGFLTSRPRYHASLADLPIPADRLAHMQSRFMCAQVVEHDAVRRLDLAMPCDAELCNAKLVNNQAANEAVMAARGLHGGYAARADNVLDRLDRDIRHMGAPAGPDDIQLVRLRQGVIGPHRPQWSQRYLQKMRRSATPTVA